MKKIITTILLILLVGCQKVTVLEIAVDGEYYKVTCSKDHSDWMNWKQNEIYQIDFVTLFGIENFINEVADVDLSQWERVK